MPMVKKETFSWRSPEGHSVFVYSWLPDSNDSLRGIVQIAHGMVETAARYERFAIALAEEGFGVYANDHLGHGYTAVTTRDLSHLPQQAFSLMADDLAGITTLIRERHSGLPVYLLGHSMGSMLVKHYMARYGDKVAGVLLSGIKAEQGVELDIGIALAKLMMKMRGERHRSKLLDFLTFSPYNKRIKPCRTKFDWLSRDPDEVDRYIGDPHSGGLPTVGFFYELFKGLKESYRKDQLERIPKDLPIYLFSGDMDPVGDYGKGVQKLASIFRGMGMKQVELKLYPGGRHEMLNEINRDEVTRDILHWLNRQA